MQPSPASGDLFAGVGGGAGWPPPRPERLSVACLSQAVESIQAEDESAKLCKRRIEHLKEHSSDQPAAASMWKRKRMDRMMVEHLLRCGYYNTAVKLARQSGIEVGLGAGRALRAERPTPARTRAPLSVAREPSGPAPEATGGSGGGLPEDTGMCPQPSIWVGTQGPRSLPGGLPGPCAPFSGLWAGSAGGCPSAVGQWSLWSPEGGVYRGGGSVAHPPPHPPVSARHPVVPQACSSHAFLSLTFPAQCSQLVPDCRGVLSSCFAWHGLCIRGGRWASHRHPALRLPAPCGSGRMLLAPNAWCFDGERERHGSNRMCTGRTGHRGRRTGDFQKVGFGGHLSGSVQLLISARVRLSRWWV